MPEARGVLNLCLPAVVLNTILRKLIAEHARPRRRSAEVRARVRELVGESSVGAVLQIPPVRLRAHELAELRPGMVLRLPVPSHSAAVLKIGGLPLGRARAVKMGEHRGARMEPLVRAEPTVEYAPALGN
jgi:flagellar motor switch protein FliM